ncbi:hypothetical protein Tco_0860765 [Tanacetum coccineum]|uniref:Integrase, catalytic region, zinc finger, CCHC-type, peptidase aspartic, catalytic n=1 Tax=Tanacetum coccineum TaxID=301880 RepID=A0ABQ5BIX0_9ASTR
MSHASKSSKKQKKKKEREVEDKFSDLNYKLMNASAKLTRAKLHKRSGDADLSKDKSGPESQPEFWRSWYVEGHIRSGVISSVLAQRQLRNSLTKGDEGPSSRGTKLNSTFIITEMTTLAEHITVAGAENRPPMLEKSMHDSWASHIHLFIKWKKHGRMMLDSINNGPLGYPTVEENGQTRPKKYYKLTEAQQLQDDYDVQATNIILHGLPPDVYALVNHQEAAKDIWDRVKMIMKGTELSYQERECRLYNLVDKFTHV